MPFGCLSHLKRYADGVDVMQANWPALKSYDMAGVQLDEVRSYSAALPSTSVALAALTIARAELVQCLFTAGEAPDPIKGAKCAREHAAAVTALRRECRHLLFINQ